MVDGDYCVCTDASLCLYLDFSAESDCFGQEVDYIKVMPTSTPLKCLFVLASVGYKPLGGDARLLVRMSWIIPDVTTVFLYYVTPHVGSF